MEHKPKSIFEAAKAVLRNEATAPRGVKAIQSKYKKLLKQYSKNMKELEDIAYRDDGMSLPHNIQRRNELNRSNEEIVQHQILLGVKWTDLWKEFDPSLDRAPSINR